MSRKTILILGPSFDNHMEPIVPPAAPTVGRRQLTFQDTPTSPGGQCHLQLLPPLHPDDMNPATIYVCFAHPDFGPAVPNQPDRTPEWFMKSGHPMSSARFGEFDEKGMLTVKVPNVQPSLKPHLCQTILEFPGQ